MRTRLLAPVTANLFRLRPQVVLVGGFWSSVLVVAGPQSATLYCSLSHTRGGWSCTPLRNPLVSPLTQPPFGPSHRSPVQSALLVRGTHVTVPCHFGPAPHSCHRALPLPHVTPGTTEFQPQRIFPRESGGLWGALTQHPQPHSTAPLLQLGASHGPPTTHAVQGPLRGAAALAHRGQELPRARR